MSQYARDLDADDIPLVRKAANSGCTSKKFAEQMSISVDQVWKFLHSPNGSLFRERFEKNDREEEAESGQ